MSDKLTNKGNFIISATSTPTSTEIANQYSPQSLKINNESLASEESGRTQDGVMHIYWIRTKVVKLEIAMPPMNATTQATILNAVQGKTFYVTYFDTVSGAERTCRAYCSGTGSDCYSGVLYNGLYTGVSFNIIEC